MHHDFGELGNAWVGHRRLLEENVFFSKPQMKGINTDMLIIVSAFICGEL
jgi:hypothetical protein